MRALAASAAVVFATLAQGAGGASAQLLPPADESAESARHAEAQRRFRRGIDLYNNDDFDAALVEFKRAYEWAPSYKILYNLGQVCYQRRDYAAALRYFRQYLTEGDDAIPVPRQRAVTTDIGDLERLVGRVEIDTTEDGAELFIDDAFVGTTPLRSLIPVNSGTRKLDLVGRAGEHRARRVEVPGGEIVRVSFPHLLPPVAPAPPAALISPAREAAGPVPWPEARKNAAPPAASVPVAVAAPPAHKSRTPWTSWAVTGLLAGGAAVTGTIAWQSKQTLDEQLGKFPQDPAEVDYETRRTRGFALATDGLLIGAAVMAALSVYLTWRDPR